jgi:hypothetical protein
MNIEGLVIDQKIKDEIANKMHEMAQEGVLEINFSSPFETIMLYHENSSKITNEIKTKALSFEIEFEGEKEKFFIF